MQEKKETILKFIEWMKENGYKKKHIAKAIGFTQNAFYRILNTKRTTSITENFMIHFMENWKPTHEEYIEMTFDKHKKSLERGH